MRELSLCLACLLCFGCASSSEVEELEARVIKAETKLMGLQRKSAQVTELAARVETVEDALDAPPPPAPLSDRVLLLEAEVDRLSKALAKRPTPTPDSPQVADTDGPTVMRPPNAVAPPPVNERVSPLSLASGNLLMVKTSAGLVRVKLRGIEVPQPLRTYTEQAALATRHRTAFGSDVTQSDAAYKASLAYLAELLTEVRLRLDYGDQPPPVTNVVEAYVVAERGPEDSFDVGGAMLRAGYAIARDAHPKAARYAGLEVGARGAKLGLFASGE